MRDPKCDGKEHVLRFSTFVMNSQHSPMIACVSSSLIFKSLPRNTSLNFSRNFLFGLFVVVVVVVAVVVFQENSSRKTISVPRKIMNNYEINLCIRFSLSNTTFCFIIPIRSRCFEHRASPAEL